MSISHQERAHKQGLCPDCGATLTAVTTTLQRSKRHHASVPVYYCPRALNEAGWYNGRYGSPPDSPHKKIRRFAVVQGKVVEFRGYLRQAA